MYWILFWLLWILYYLDFFVSRFCIIVLEMFKKDKYNIYNFNVSFDFKIGFFMYFYVLKINKWIKLFMFELLLIIVWKMLLFIGNFGKSLDC